MQCSFCRKETDKILKCAIRGVICLKCCFHISSGSSEHLRRLKQENKLIKVEVLKFCGECAIK